MILTGQAPKVRKTIAITKKTILIAMKLLQVFSLKMGTEGTSFCVCNVIFSVTKKFYKTVNFIKKNLINDTKMSFYFTFLNFF